MSSTLKPTPYISQRPTFRVASSFRTEGIQERLARLTLRAPLLPLIVAAVIGILLDHLLRSQVANLAAMWLVLTSGLIAAYFICSIERRWWISPLLMIPMFAIRHSVEEQSYDRASIVALLGNEAQPAIVEATIDAPATLQPHPLASYGMRRDVSKWQTEFACRLDRIRVGQEMVPVSGRVAVIVDGECVDHRPGESVRLYGTLRPPSPPTNPGERDVASYFRQQNLHARMTLDSENDIDVLKSAPWSFFAWTATIANRARETLLRQTADSTGGLAVALVVGHRDFVEPPTRDLLLVTGTAHLLSVSGLHLAIVVLLARYIGILLRLSPSLQLVHIIAVSVMYAAITGGRPPVMRASILIGLFVLSMILRRPNQPINTLSLAALLLLAYKPSLLSSIGVQLSFLAVATLMLCGRRGGDSWSSLEQITEQDERLRELADSASPALWRYLRWIGCWIRQASWYSGCVSAISMPLVWHQFNVISPISILTNVCLSIPLAVALGTGIATVIVGSVSQTFAAVPGFFCDQSLALMLAMIRFFASIPYGHFWLPPPPTWAVVVFYIGIGGSLMLPAKRSVCRARYLWIVGWLATTFFLATRPAPLETDAIEATFVDVGHGTSVILRFSQSDVWLYDCGRLGNSIGSGADIETVLWSLGVTRLRGVMISHADIDHYNALPALLSRFQIEAVYSPPTVFADQEELLSNLRQEIEARGIRRVDLKMGMKMQSSGATVDILHPPAERLRGSDNANSLVAVISKGTRTPLILPGDLEPPGTETLLWQPRPPAGGVLMAPHHGSMQLPMRPILDWSRALAVIVSGGDRAAKPEVSAALSVTGAVTFVTAKVGAIRVRTHPGGRLEIRSWANAPW